MMNIMYLFPWLDLLLHSLLVVCYATLAFGKIAEALGKTNWNLNADPCLEGRIPFIFDPYKEVSPYNEVSCNCSFAILPRCLNLRAQNLTGTLPPELVRLPYLQQIDLTRNYLNGTIPPEWGSMQLVNISLLGNRLTGSVPKELGNITTLKSLAIDMNMFSGVLPLQLGNLSNIERMILSSNKFTGELPETFANLTTLKDFRISDNNFSGKIPDFIQNWTNLQRIEIQASGLTGPIPSSISLLKELTNLRITDLNGTEAPLPQLKDMTKLKTLMLRSCNITGQLPPYLGEITTLKTLDLSFNKLTGEVPPSFANLKVNYMFLTGNLLTGLVPDWLTGGYVDLSYNNFTNPNAVCSGQGLNLFASSSKGNSSGTIPCMKSASCPKTWYSLHINCGGPKVTVDGDPTPYYDDTDSVGASSFVEHTNWALSSTGHIPDDNDNRDNYIWNTSSRLSMTNPELYTTARGSPISLTYYGFCLGNGNYKVNLHFAEIIFTNDTTFSSLGRRVFDVYIQGKLVLKDFNIAEEARGVGKEVVRKFPAVVTNKTLEIRLYWAGKGTTGIPFRGVLYGPLISAIYADLSSSEGSSISIGVLVGIVAGGVVFNILLILYSNKAILWMRRFLEKKNTLEQGLKGLDLQTGKFSLKQIKSATDNFNIANKIGEGGFGSVYKGLLSDGTIIAVKQLSSKSKQGNREFLNEIGMISALQHPHLVKLYGCCIEGNQLLLVYEYMENNNVGHALFGPEKSQLKLDWPTRCKICVGIARGLAYLHEESRLKIVHRDIKATNVLLDRDFNPKISDFGLAKLDEQDNTHISTRIAGTCGYMAPEYALRGYLTDKADVYSFGIVVLEIVSGRSNTSYRSKEECFYLLDWALLLKEKGNLMDLVDPRLGSDYNKEEMMLTINVALLCSNVSAAVRPTMSSVVSMLEGKAAVEELVLDPTASSNKINAMRKHFETIFEGTKSDSQTQTMSTEWPWTASFSSAQDLYPVNLDSDTGRTEIRDIEQAVLIGYQYN